MPTHSRGVIVLAGLVLLAGCASEVVRHPAALSVAAQSGRYVVANTASFKLDSGYERTLAAGTEFVEAGSIVQGKVFKPVNTVFTVEGAHMHEAYPVVNGARLVGFYLPVEKSFSPLSQTILIQIQQKGDAK